jgi:hypothetical protein
MLVVLTFISSVGQYICVIFQVNLHMNLSEI